MKRIIVSTLTLLLTLTLAFSPLSVSHAEETIAIDFTELFEMVSGAFGEIDAYSEDELLELQPTISVVSADIFLALCAVEGDDITFDGYVLSSQNEIVICPGDFEDRSFSSWGFIVDDSASYSELKLLDGEDVTVTANIVGRNDENMIVLDQAQIYRRDATTMAEDDTITAVTVEESIDIEGEVDVDPVVGDLAAEDVNMEQSNIEEPKSFEDALVEMLALKSSYDPGVEQFATDYSGYTIELDGFVYECDENWPNRENYDLIICNGDFENRPEHFKYFKFENVGAQEFGFEGNVFPEWVAYSNDVRIVAQIIGYEDDLHSCILLSPISIEHRNPLTEEIVDTSMYTELSNGSKGDAVRALQQRLVDLKYLSGKVDGQYGNQTKGAIEKFQRACNLEVTGIADPMTQAVLFSDNAPEATLSISCSSVVMGSSAKTVWYVDGQEFTLTGNKTKAIKTVWGTYKFNAYGEYEKID